MAEVLPTTPAELFNRAVTLLGALRASAEELVARNNQLELRAVDVERSREEYSEALKLIGELSAELGRPMPLAAANCEIAARLKKKTAEKQA